MNRHPSPAAAAILVALLSLPLPAGGQIVRGQVVEEGSNSPVEGAMVLLLELDQRTVHRVLTDASGGFILDADRPGPHLIRVDRIGYESLTTPRFDVPVEGTFRRVTVPIRPVELAGIAVEGARRCEVRGEQGEATARVWEEARKALEAAAWTLESGVYRYTLLQFERDLEADARTVRKESRRFNRGTGQAPYVSVPADALAEQGFIQVNRDRSATYFAPDAAAFLSDAFLDTHCMQIGPVRDGEIGLEFEPIRGRRLPDIRGTLWLDAATAQLRRLEFRYVNRPVDHDMGDAGGEVVFGRLPNGTWIVRDWGIRMPILGANPQRTRLVVLGYQVQGGIVWRVSDPGGTTVLEAATASLGGAVTDSLGNGPLPGVTVREQSGEGVAVTGGAGTFFLPGLAPGMQSLELSHPSLDSLGLGPVFRGVEVAAGEVASPRIRFPGVAEVLAEACTGAPAEDRETTVVLGRVRVGGAPAAGYRVRVRWLAGTRRGFQATARAAPEQPGFTPPVWEEEEDDPRWLSTTLDARGIFMLCGVPTSSQLRVEVVTGGFPTAETVTLPAGRSTVFVPIHIPESRDP